MATAATPSPAPLRTIEDVQLELNLIDEVEHENALTTTADQPQSATPPEHNYEREAHRKGWKPKESYEGPADTWVDAKTFVERGERFAKRLEGEVASLKAKVDGFEGTKAQFRKFFDEQMAKRDREHSEAIAALRIQRSQAIREGEDALAIELEDRIDATKEQQRALKGEAAAIEANAVSAAPVEDSPVLLEWISDGNDWFKKDEILTKHAIAIGEAFRKQGDKSIGRVFLDRVSEQVRADFPRRFKPATTAAPRNSTTEASGQGGTGTGNSDGYNGKTERDLPQADLAIMRQFIKEGLYTKEQFLKSYFSRNG